MTTMGQTMGEHYKGNYNGSLKGFTIKTTDSLLKREIELEEILKGKTFVNPMKAEAKELNLIEFIKSANISKESIGDKTDDINQNHNFFAEADIVYGIAKELGIDLKTFYQD